MDKKNCSVCSQDYEVCKNCEKYGRMKVFLERSCNVDEKYGNSEVKYIDFLPPSPLNMI